MNLQYDRLLEMRRELDRKIYTIAGTKKILNQIRIADAGRSVIRRMENSVYLMLTKVRSSSATSSGEIEEDIRRHLKRCEAPDIQALPMGASIGKEAFMRGEYSYKNVFSFAEVDKSELKNARVGNRRNTDNYGSINKKQAVLTEMRPGEYLTAVSRESDGDIVEIYEEMKALLRKEQKELCSDIYILSIVNVIDPNEERKYLKYIFVSTIDL